MQSMSAPEIRSSDGSTRPGATVGTDSLPPLDLDGQDLSFIRIDYQVRLQFHETEVVIETPFVLASHDEQWLLDPERRGELGPLLATYPATLRSAAVRSDLTLQLTFESGSSIEVPQHLHYEAWQIVGPGSRLVVCPPAGDGKLALWR